jgi:hypothetical protein
VDPQIQELIDRMRELVNTMRETSKTGAVNNDKARSDTDPLAKSFTRNVDRLITSLGMLSVKLDGTSRTRAGEEHAAKRFTANVNRATKAQDQQNAAIEENIKAQRRAAMTADEIAAEQKKIAQDAASTAANAASTAVKTASDNAKTAQRAKEDATREAAYKAQGILSGNKLNSALTAMAGSSVAAHVALQSVSGVLSGARGVGAAMTGFGASLASGNTAFTSLNGVIGALGSAAGKLPLFGGGLEAIAKGSSFLITQIETTVDTFKELAQVGALTEKGMTGIQEQFFASGQSMAGFKKNVIDFAPALARFKGDVGTGASEFAKITGSILDKNGEFADLGTQLRRLGMGADQFGEATADYIKMQSQLGLAQKKDYRQLAVGSAEYAKEIDLLSRATGVSRKAIQGQIDAALSESRFRATIDEMNDTGQEKAATALTLFQARVSQVNSELGQAVRDISSGVPDSAVYQKFVAAGFDVGKIVQAIKSGAMDLNTAMEQTQAGTRGIAKFVRQQADINKGVDEIFPGYAKLSDFNNAQIKSGEVVVATQKKLAEGNDGLTNNVVTAQEALLQASRNITNFGFALMPTATGAIAEFTKVLSDSVTRIAKELNIKLPNIDGSAAPATGPVAQAAAAVETARGTAKTSWDGAVSAAEKQQADKAALAALKAAGASAADKKIAEEKLVKSTQEAAAAREAANKADEEVTAKIESARKEQAKYEKLSTVRYYKNFHDSVWMGEQTITDEKTKLSFTFNELKLSEKDNDNYQRFIKRKDELLDAELESFKTKNKREASGSEQSSIAELTRNQARKEFLPAATAVGAARTIRPAMQPGDLEAPVMPSVTAPESEWIKYRAADKKFTEESKQKRSTPATPKTADYTPPAAGPQTSPRAAQPSTASATGQSPLAELVARGESAGAGGYNAANAGGTNKAYKAGDKNLTGLTIGEVQAAQANGEIFAAGRYQIIPATLNDAVQQLGLKTTDKFDESMQDLIFKEYLTGAKRPEIQSFLSGDKAADVDAAVLALAKEFASVGVPTATKRPANLKQGIPAQDLRAGDSYYKGVGRNPPTGSISPEEARAALKLTRDQTRDSLTGKPIPMADGGVIKSTPGGVGVIAGEAGRNEAFVPLPDGKSIPVKQDTTVIKDVQNLSAQVSGLSKLLAGKMITQTGATDDEQGMGIKTSTIITKLLKTAFPVLGQIEKIGGIGNTVAGVADTDSKMSGFDKFLEVAKMLSPQIRVLSGIYDTVKPFLQSDDNTATLAKRQMPVAPDLSAAMTDLGNLASTNTPNLGEIASPSIDRADMTSNSISTLVDELKKQNTSNMKDAMSSVTDELKDALKGMSPQSQGNSSSQELVAAMNEMVRTQRDTNAISSRILQVSQN